MTIHLHTLPRLGMSRAIHLLPHTSSCPAQRLYHFYYRCLVCPSVRPSLCNKSIVAEGSFIKFGFGEFLLKFMFKDLIHSRTTANSCSVWDGVCSATGCTATGAKNARNKQKLVPCKHRLTQITCVLWHTAERMCQHCYAAWFISWTCLCTRRLSPTFLISSPYYSFIVIPVFTSDSNFSCYSSGSHYYHLLSLLQSSPNQYYCPFSVPYKPRTQG